MMNKLHVIGAHLGRGPYHGDHERAMRASAAWATRHSTVTGPHTNAAHRSSTIVAVSARATARLPAEVTGASRGERSSPSG
jgi:hypothetical protein